MLVFFERGALHRRRARRRQGRVAGAHDRRSACPCRPASSCPPTRSRRRSPTRSRRSGRCSPAASARETSCRSPRRPRRSSRRPIPAGRSPRRSPRPTRGSATATCRSPCARARRPRTPRRPASPASRRPTCTSAASRTIVERIRDCWSSFFTERALFYRREKGSLDRSRDGRRRPAHGPARRVGGPVHDRPDQGPSGPHGRRGGLRARRGRRLGTADARPLRPRPRWSPQAHAPAHPAVRDRPRPRRRHP